MWGLIAERTAPEGIIEICGVRFYQMPMETAGLFKAHRRRRAWKKLRQKRIRQAVIPPTLLAEGTRWGIRPVEVYPLRRALWPQLTRPGVTAAIRAERGEEAVGEAAAVLAQRFRYVRLEIGYGAASVERMLLHCYGLCAGGGEEPTLTLSFGGRPLAADEICLGEDCTQWQEAVYAPVALPANTRQSEQLLSALYLSGGLKKEEICLKSLDPALDRREETHYNAM